MRPKREVATRNGQTYFVTSGTAGRRGFFKHEGWSELLIRTMYRYRPEKMLIHGFVVMPDHFHLLTTPMESLEKVVQYVKGGFSYQAKRELGWPGEIWAVGFSDHRIRDEEDFEVHRRYIRANPVKSRLVDVAEEYPYSSVNSRFELDAFPRGLKPPTLGGGYGGAEAPPFQNKSTDGVVHALSQSKRADGFAFTLSKQVQTESNSEQK